ncbi:MAG: hypothetical protein SGI91_16080 [Alphaproteobacteria bacterium]|nr:hypothetical protein [Alphaproteobacteria bacterium]
MSVQRFATAALCALFLAVSATAHAAPWDDAKGRTTDIDALHAFMKATHPDLYHHTKQAEMDAYVATFRRDAVNMSWPRYVMGVYRMIRLVGDGHTAIFPFPDAGPGFDTRIPVLTEAFADGLYIIAADTPYQGAVGGKVTAINGKPAADIVRTLTEYWPHENEMWVVRWLPTMLRRPGYLHGAGLATGDVTAAVTFTIAGKDGARRDIAVTPIAASDDEAHQKAWTRVRNESKLTKPTPLHGVDTPFGFHHLKDRKAVYAVYRQSDDSEAETVAAFAARLFKYVDENPIDRLIIDIRENGGGNNYKNQALLLAMIKARKIDRPGHLFILTGRQTFSAAQNFANQAERWTQALFVGEPTGSSPNHFGDAKQFELPATKLAVIVATLRWQDSDPKDTRIWIRPDIVARDTFADYTAGRDTALEAALAYRLPGDFKETDPVEHWQSLNQWTKTGDTYAPRNDFPFAW